MRLLLLVLACVALPLSAAEPELRPSAGLLFKSPELLRPGTCVRYQEGGAGWIATEPVFYLRGTVVSAAVETRHVGRCPEVPGKALAQYSRAEFVRHARAYPCVSARAAERDTQLGVVRVKVSDWETPHERKAENAGRLYRGAFLDRQLEKDMEIELEADLLGPCTS